MAADNEMDLPGLRKSPDPLVPIEWAIGIDVGVRNLGWAVVGRDKDECLFAHDCGHEDILEQEGNGEGYKEVVCQNLKKYMYNCLWNLIPRFFHHPITAVVIESQPNMSSTMQIAMMAIIDFFEMLRNTVQVHDKMKGAFFIIIQQNSSRKLKLHVPGKETFRPIVEKCKRTDDEVTRRKKRAKAHDANKQAAITLVQNFIFYSAGLNLFFTKLSELKSKQDDVCDAILHAIVWLDNRRHGRYTRKGNNTSLDELEWTIGTCIDASFWQPGPIYPIFTTDALANVEILSLPVGLHSVVAKPVQLSTEDQLALLRQPTCHGKIIFIDSDSDSDDNICKSKKRKRCDDGKSKVPTKRLKNDTDV